MLKQINTFLLVLVIVGFGIQKLQLHENNLILLNVPKLISPCASVHSNLSMCLLYFHIINPFSTHQGYRIICVSLNIDYIYYHKYINNDQAKPENYPDKLVLNGLSEIETSTDLSLHTYQLLLCSTVQLYILVIFLSSQVYLEFLVFGHFLQLHGLQCLQLSCFNLP